MSRVIKFIGVSAEEIEMVCGIVPCILIDDTTLLVPVDCQNDLVEIDDDGDEVWINGLIGKIVNL